MPGFSTARRGPRATAQTMVMCSVPADRSVTRERSLIVQGAMEASRTPLMERLEQDFPGIKVFSLPSVDHPQWGRHIELGVKGEAASLDSAYATLREGVVQFGASIGTELVR